jgi:dihydrolipoamide dehydrogenase
MHMKRDVDVVIVGTGTAALAAASEVKRVTDNFIIVSNGVYGTTCVRAGCMPSKVLIQAANLFHQRTLMKRAGINGASQLRLDSKATMEYVREMRGHFLRYALESTEKYRSHIIEGDIRFHSPVEIEIGGDSYVAGGIILATGSSPIIPDECKYIDAQVITSDTLFDLERLPPALAVMGLSVLGAEMAQAFSRLGCQINAFHDESIIGGLSDPEISRKAVSILSEEMDITLNTHFGGLVLQAAKENALFVAMSRKANLENIGLEQCGIRKPGAPVIDYDPTTMQVGDFPVVAGDVKLGRSILHETSDEGHIAGYNATRKRAVKFKRRVPMQVTYTNPAIAVVGAAWNELPGGKFITGKASYKNQGRAIIMGSNKGLLHIYADPENGKLLGAELVAPQGEHLAHELSWLMYKEITVSEALRLPFYHPTIEEGLRTALEDAASQLGLDSLSYHGLNKLTGSEI